MVLDLHPLGPIAASAGSLSLAAVWATGMVLALRRRPAPGATAAATGFGLLAAIRLWSSAASLSSELSDVGSPAGFSDPGFYDSMISFEPLGLTVLLPDGSLGSTVRLAAGVIEAVGAGLLVVGLLRAWRDPHRPSLRSPKASDPPQ